MAPISYTETQHFRSLWIWLLVFALNGLMTFMLIWQVLLGRPVGNNPAPDIMIVLFWLLMIAFAYFIYTTALRIRIDGQGIWFSYFPLLSNPRQINWSEVERLQLRSSRPLQEFGGWGIRFAAGGLRVYNVSGKLGLQVYFRDERKIFLGTQRAQELWEALKTIKTNYQIEHITLENDLAGN